MYTSAVCDQLINLLLSSNMLTAPFSHQESDIYYDDRAVCFGDTRSRNEYTQTSSFVGLENETENTFETILWI